MRSGIEDQECAKRITKFVIPAQDGIHFRESQGTSNSKMD
jgi:hypothetical protein